MSGGGGGGGGGTRPAYLRSAPIRRLRHPLDESPAWALIGACLWGLLGLTLALPLLIILAVVLPTTFILRWFLLMFYWNRQRTSNTNSLTSGGLESMRGNDSRWLGSSWHCSVLHAVLMFETPLEVSTLQQLLMNRVVPVYPRLTRRPVSLPLVAGAGYCWLPDCNFSIENHVFPGPNLPLAEPQIQEYVSQLLCKGLPIDKPPWELHVLRQCAILRVHQSVADGTALVKLLCHCLADTKIMSNTQNRRRPLSFYCDVLKACLLGPLSLLFWILMSSPDCNLLTQSSVDCKSGVKVTWSAGISFAKVTRVKQVTRSTVNCVLLSALSGALRCLLQNCGVRQPPDLKVLLPVDLRRCTHRSSKRLGNKLAPVTISLPVGMEGAVPRLWNTRKTLNTLKHSTDPVVVYVATAALMSLLPGHFARQILSNISEDKASLQFSSQIGPTSNIMMGGCALKSVYAFLPAQSHLNVSVSVFSYGDQLFVTVATDHALGPAGNILLNHLQTQVELLYNLLKYRRVPGEMKTDSNVYRFPDVTRSPVREIAYRLNHVQEEVQRLSRHEINESEKLQRLKAEFSHLLRELRKRKASSSPEQDLDLWDHQFRSRRRSMSCSFTRRSSVTLLNMLSTNRPVSYTETSNTSSSILQNKSPSPTLSRITSPTSIHYQQKQIRRNTTGIVDEITNLKQSSPNEIYYRRTSTPIFSGSERLTDISECAMCYDTLKHSSHSNLFKLRFGQRNFVKSYSQPSNVNDSPYYHYGNDSNVYVNKNVLKNYRSQPTVKTLDTNYVDRNQIKKIHQHNREQFIYLDTNVENKKTKHLSSSKNKLENNRHSNTCDRERSNCNYDRLKSNSKLTQNTIAKNCTQCYNRDDHDRCCNRFDKTNRFNYQYRDNYYTDINNTSDSQKSDRDMYNYTTERCNLSDDNSTGGLYDEILYVIKDNKPLSTLYSYNSISNRHNYRDISVLQETDEAQLQLFNDDNNERSHGMNEKLYYDDREEISCDKRLLENSTDLSQINLGFNSEPCCSKSDYNSYPEKSIASIDNNKTQSNFGDNIKKFNELGYNTAIENLSNFANKVHKLGDSLESNYTNTIETKLYKQMPTSNQTKCRNCNCIKTRGELEKSLNTKECCTSSSIPQIHSNKLNYSNNSKQKYYSLSQQHPRYDNVTSSYGDESSHKYTQRYSDKFSTLAFQSDETYSRLLSTNQIDDKLPSSSSSSLNKSDDNVLSPNKQSILYNKKYNDELSIPSSSSHQMQLKNNQIIIKEPTIINNSEINLRNDKIILSSSSSSSETSSSASSSTSSLYHKMLVPIGDTTKSKCCDNKIKLLESKGSSSNKTLQSQSESFYNSFSYDNSDRSTNISNKPNTSSHYNYDKVTFI